MNAKKYRIFKSHILIVILGIFILSCRTTAQPTIPPMTADLKAEAMDYIAESLRETVEVVGDSFPVATENGVWDKDTGGWTGGYFAGMLWMMYQATEDRYWLDQAQRYTEFLERLKDDVNNIDVGILFWPSFDLGYAVAGIEKYREVGLAGARTMMKRFIPSGGYLQNWGRLGDPEQKGFVIVDCLINLDHLYWATRETGDSSFFRAATSHAGRSRVSHVRPDGSSYQVVEFDPETGMMLRGFKKQGYTDESTWSRGQSWGIYGFTRVYKHTRDKKFLATAMKMADWFIAHLPVDYVPYWDFSAPGIPDDARDTSAASMAASALIELSTLVEEPGKADYYKKSAEKILSSLTVNYLTRDLPGSNYGVLTGGTYFYEIGRGVNQANIWGDFYYLEALMRWGE